MDQKYSDRVSWLENRSKLLMDSELIKETSHRILLEMINLQTSLILCLAEDVEEAVKDFKKFSARVGHNYPG